MVFSSFRIKNLVSIKDFVPQLLRSSLIYIFNCEKCNSVNAGETSRHLSTRVHEHLYSDKNSHIFKHLKSSDKCSWSCNNNCVTVLDSASTYNQHKYKEVLHVNIQVKLYDISLSF